MLFFDLEAYAPPGQRDTTRSSLIVNPARSGHFILGGCFHAKRFADPVSPEPTIEHLWIWNFRSEEELLRAIRELFEREWARQRKERVKILGKPATDLVVCGAGIAKFDLPALLCRAHLQQIAPFEELFEVFMKARPIDLANSASFLFPEEEVLYPKTTKEIAGRLGAWESKGSSTRVWDLYEAERFEEIEARTEGELRLVLTMYTRLQERIRRR